MRIVIYVLGNFVTCTDSAGFIVQGLWSDPIIQEFAERNNIYKLIDAAIKLPVTRVTLEI